MNFTCHFVLFIKIADIFYHVTLSNNQSIYLPVTDTITNNYYYITRGRRGRGRLSLDL
jgi:hypothetical protein